MPDWKKTRAAMAADHDRLAGVLGRPPRLHAGLFALRLYRIGHWLFQHGHKTPARLMWAANMLLTGADIDNGSVIGPGCILRNPRGIVMYGILGPDCTLEACSGFGGKSRGAVEAIRDGLRFLPEIGARCVLGGRVVVQGGIQVGDDCTILPGCTVHQDLPANSTIQSRPGAWRSIRLALHRRRRPDDLGATRLGAVIRADVMRCVLENASSDVKVGAVRFWAHLILPSVQGVVLFRLSRALHVRGWRRGAALLARINRTVYGLTIHPASEIGPGLFCPHPVGVSVCGRAGPLLSLYPHCSVGPENWPGMTSDLPADSPVLGTDVGIGAHSEVVGALRLGDLVMVGVAVRVARDIADGLTVVPRRNWILVTPDEARTGSGPGDIAGMQPQAAD